MNKSLANIVAVLLAGVVVPLTFILNRDFFHDDAFITLRYSRNLLEGLGPVWNAGEFVQGYSNFLQMILVAGLGLFTDDLIVAAQVIGVVAYVLLLLMVWLFAKNNEAFTPSTCLLPVLIAALSAPIIVWSLGGLETVLYTLLVTAGSLCALSVLNDVTDHRMAILGGLIFALALLTRPDAIVFIGLSAGFFVLRGLRTREFKPLIWAALSLFLVVFPYMVWQYTYYGDWLPNTFYAKADDASLTKALAGFDYVLNYAVRWPFLMLLLFPALFAVRLRQSWCVHLSYLSFTVFGYLSYVIYVGGDHMQSFRFIAPVVPAMGILLALCLARLDTGRSARIIALAPIILVLLSVGQLKNGRLSPGKMDPAAYVGSVVGSYINLNWPADSLIALNTAGSIPFFAPGQNFIDMLGLNDRTIGKRANVPMRLEWQRVPGHAKGDGAYVLDRQPDYIILGPARGAPASEPWFLSDIEISEDPRLAMNYELRSVILKQPDGADFSFVYYQRL